MQLLLVDDDPMILDLLPRVLERQGYPEVKAVSSGASALEALNARNNEFDLLILDISMPVMDGITLCKKIRKLSRYRDVPIVMLTANSDLSSVERAFAAGANDYITKPFALGDIGKRIELTARNFKKVLEMPNLDPFARSGRDVEGDHEFAFEDPLRLVNASQYTDRYSLANYMWQIERSQLKTTTVFAIRNNEFDVYYDNMTTHEYACTLFNMTKSISKVLDSESLLMSYVGDGTFIGISNDDLLEYWSEIEEMLQADLRQTLILPDRDTHVPATVTLGRPIRAQPGSPRRVTRTFERALDTLQLRLCREKSVALKSA
ncbi:response regulator [Sulfitobacter sp. HNIBRBA3233]|uniref:response regulator n=1 Tax=Sulfitobacter marinivivus TaxID=3158558 RepID=UPI0032DEB3F7